MRLLSITSSSKRDGSNISLLITLIGLKQKGVKLLVIVPQEGFLTDELKKNYISYAVLPYIPFWSKPSLRSYKDILKYLPRLARILWQERKGIKSIEQLIKNWKPDFIHTNVSIIDIGYKAAKKNLLPHIWHVREYGDLDFDIYPLTGKKRFQKKLNSSYCLCITHDLKTYHNIHNNGLVVYNAIIEDETIISETTIKENRILYVGRLTENKGIGEVIKSFIDFAKINKEYNLEILGRSEDAKYYQYLRNLVDFNNVSNRIQFAGQVSDVAERMQKSKAIIVASKQEGFGRITAEAMLNKCLVIGKDTGGTKEQFDNGLEYCAEEIGIRYVSQSNLTNALIKLADLDSKSYDRILKNAYYTVKQYYNKDQNITRIYSLLKEISNK